MKDATRMEFFSNPKNYDLPDDFKNVENFIIFCFMMTCLTVSGDFHRDFTPESAAESMEPVALLMLD